MPCMGLGDDAWDNLLQWHHRTLRGCFSRHSGQKVGSEGDGFFVVFEAISSAANCASDIQRALARHRQDNGFAPEVRKGTVPAGCRRDNRLASRFRLGRSIWACHRRHSRTQGPSLKSSPRPTAEATFPPPIPIPLITIRIGRVLLVHVYGCARLSRSGRGGDCV